MVLAYNIAFTITFFTSALVCVFALEAILRSRGFVRGNKHQFDHLFVPLLLIMAISFVIGTYFVGFS